MFRWIYLLVFISIQLLFPKENILYFENLPDKIFSNTEATLICGFKNSHITSIKKWTWSIELWNNGDTFLLNKEDSAGGISQSQWHVTINSVPDSIFCEEYTHYGVNFYPVYTGYIMVFAVDSDNNKYSLIQEIDVFGKKLYHEPFWGFGDFVAIISGKKLIHQNEVLSYTSIYFDDDESGERAEYWNWRFFTFNENGKYLINSADSIYSPQSSTWEFKFDSLDNHFNYIRDSLNDIIAFLTVNTTSDELFYYSNMNEIKITTAPLNIDEPQILQNADFTLFPNYPNPFNPRTTISWQLPFSCYVELNIYNMLGQEVAKLVNEKQTAGLHHIEFNADGFASGIYIYKLKTASFEQSREMTLLR
ncbi:MAG: T9SS type A sorting domain-containing protein [Calditrichaceae bacterium]